MNLQYTRSRGQRLGYMVHAISVAFAIAAVPHDLVRADCPARRENPHHVEIEQLARDDVYAIEPPSLVDEAEDEIKKLQQLLEKAESKVGRPNGKYDRIAKNIKEKLEKLRAYVENQKSLTDAFAEKGFSVIDGINGSTTGFQALVFRDDRPGMNGQTHVVFRGTEGGKRGYALYADLIADLPGADPAIADTPLGGIGELQYDRNSTELAAWAKKYPESIVSGQSLGAALAQIYIARHPGAVKEGILFNAPGVRKKTVEEYFDNLKKLGIAAPPITIYVAKGDVISDFGGERHIPGRIVEISGGNVDKSANVDVKPPSGSFFEDLLQDGLAAHRNSMLQDDSGTDCDEKDFAAYEAGRPANLPSGWRKNIEATVAALDMMSPRGRKRLLDFINSWKDHQENDLKEVSRLERIAEVIFWGSIARDQAVDRAAVDAYDEIIRRHHASMNEMAGKPNLPRVYIHRPPGWGIVK